MTNALVTLHMQEGVVERSGIPGLAAAERLGAAMAVARRAGILIVHVRMAFRPGLVDVAPAARRDPFISRFEDGAPAARMHPEVAPAPGDIDVVGKRASAFKGSDLPVVLDVVDGRELVVAGIGTSGVVLATVFEAADLGYRVSVLSDACADPDHLVHEVLCERVLPLRANVLTVAEWSAAIGQS